MKIRIIQTMLMVKLHRIKNLMDNLTWEIRKLKRVVIFDLSFKSKKFNLYAFQWTINVDLSQSLVIK
jgi:hypothetical protein